MLLVYCFNFQRSGFCIFELSHIDFPLYVIIIVIVKARSFLVPVGNLNLCPNAIRNLQEHGTRNLRQHGQFCYELRTETDDWMSASSDCFSYNNGFLVQIMSQQDQNFIMNFLREENVHVPVWIGLNDRGRGMEEHFYWDSGKAVSWAYQERGQEVSLEILVRTSLEKQLDTSNYSSREVCTMLCEI